MTDINIKSHCLTDKRLPQCQSFGQPIKAMAFFMIVYYESSSIMPLSWPDTHLHLQQAHLRSCHEP